MLYTRGIHLHLPLFPSSLILVGHMCRNHNTPKFLYVLVIIYISTISTYIPPSTNYIKNIPMQRTWAMFLFLPSLLYLNTKKYFNTYRGNNLGYILTLLQTIWFFNVFGVKHPYMGTAFKVSFKRLRCPEVIKKSKCSSDNRTQDPWVASQKPYVRGT